MYMKQSKKTIGNLRNVLILSPKYLILDMFSMFIQGLHIHLQNQGRGQIFKCLILQHLRTNIGVEGVNIQT